MRTVTSENSRTGKTATAISLRRRAAAVRVDINTVQNALHDRGYESVFCHDFGNQNTAILWLNLQSGDELLTIARAPERFGSEQTFRSTAIYRIMPTFDLLENLIKEN